MSHEELTVQTLIHINRITVEFKLFYIEKY